jgi:mRNA-degrading endonuclease toxin of MazEF toxin-antitoxin module
MRVVSRGEVWEYIVGSQQYRVLVISNDEWNDQPGVSPWGLFIARTGPQALAVRLTDSDPLPGAVVHIPKVFRVDPSGLRTNLGHASHDTMNAIEEALRDFLALP